MQTTTQSSRRFFAALLCVATASLLVPAASADENFLGYSYGSETLPKGHAEIYQWITQRQGKADGTYRATDYATEFEFGLGDRLQASLYLTGARYDIRGVTDFDDTDHTVFTGTKVSFKYALRSPYKDGYGFALYVEPEYSTIDQVPGDRVAEYGLETKLIFQKNYLDDSLIYIANLMVEPELAKEHGETNHELTVEFTHGVSYRIAANWYLGLENRWTSHFEPIRLSHWEEWTCSAGPTIHYGAQRWWFTATWLPQVTGWPATQHGLALDDHERNEYRLKVGFNF
jgi:hypothetical protein